MSREMNTQNCSHRWPLRETVLKAYTEYTGMQTGYARNEPQTVDMFEETARAREVLGRLDEAERLVNNYGDAVHQAARASAPNAPAVLKARAELQLFLSKYIK